MWTVRFDDGHVVIRRLSVLVEDMREEVDFQEVVISSSYTGAVRIPICECHLLGI